MQFFILHITVADPRKKAAPGEAVSITACYGMYIPWLGKACSVALGPFSFSNLAPVASNQRGHQMCAHLQTVCCGSLEVQQTCGVISVDEGMCYDELRFS